MKFHFGRHGLYISALKPVRKLNFLLFSHLRHKHNLRILSHMDGFLTCSSVYKWSEGPIAQLGTLYVHHTLYTQVMNNVTLEIFCIV